MIDREKIEKNLLHCYFNRLAVVVLIFVTSLRGVVIPS